MGLRINTNVSSLSAQRTLGANTARMNSNLRKLSSGKRITQSADDAAGLALSENLRSQIRGIRQAERNANDAISLIQTAEGGLGEISNILIRLREFAVQSASDTIGDAERAFSEIEFMNLKEEIDRIARSSEFNGIKLLDGSTGRLEFQVGINNDPILDRLQYDGTRADGTLASLGLLGETIGSKEGAQLSLEKLDDALVQINGVRSGFGALQNRLSSTISNLQISNENLSAAKSRIADVDVASETAALTKNNILVQAGTSVLSQANQLPNVALKLIG